MQSIRFEQLTTKEIIRYATLTPELVTVSDVLEMARRLEKLEEPSLTFEFAD